MKKLLAAFAFATLIASQAMAEPRYLPSYECAPAQYDSSGAPVAQHCD
jgi:hypothetical protein